MIFGETGPVQPNQTLLRFAPSPNGLLHLGHAYSALLNQQHAKALGGTLLLRIEDIDKNRSSAAHITAIKRDLHWLGLTWPEPVLHQSDHMPAYRRAIDQLQEAGLTYPCFATRGDIRRYWQQHALTQGAEAGDLPTDPDGALLYPGLYKEKSPDEVRERIEAGAPYCLRLDMQKAITAAEQRQGGPLTQKTYDAEGRITTRPLNPARWGDVIIARKDVPTSYHIAVVVDDDRQRVTHICRGRDLAASTDIHRLLQVLLQLREPFYHHHELVAFRGEKLSKSKRHPALFELRRAGLRPGAIRAAAEKGPTALESLLGN